MNEFKKIPLLADFRCEEKIPCNPCESSCPFGAISVGSDITELPRIDAGKCNGCGICVAVCPGLAVRLVGNLDGRGIVALPFEYVPVPETGTTVKAADISGRIIGEARIIKYRKPLKGDPTNLVYLEADAGIVEQIWSFQCAGEAVQAKPVTALPGEHEDIIVCRCEEVTQAEIIGAIEKGADTIDAVKRRTRAGMGRCQGKSCSRIISGLIAKYGKTGRIPPPGRSRQPVIPLSLEEMASGTEVEIIDTMEAVDGLIEDRQGNI